MQMLREAAAVPVAPAGAPAIIELRDIHKSFQAHGQDLQIFGGVNTAIGRRSFLSIVGPSGCGKSTLLRLVSGLDPATRGTVVFNGKAVTGPAKGMIYVFQQYTRSILPWRTVIQNIEFGLRSHKQVGVREGRELCREYVRLVGLEGYEDYFPSQLSGGMQQRVVIARALICEPDVLLMDEPFSAVDAMTRAILQELLIKIWEKLPITVLFVTHDVDEAVFLSTRIISLGKAPAGIKEDVAIDLPFPRDPIRTREDERFGILRRRLFASIFTQEKQGMHV
jgi:NitT/TauT family transport system ATP-binding protein